MSEGLEPLFEHRCVPLCGADKAYGRFVQPWHHSPLCPARRRSVPADPSEEPLTWRQRLARWWRRINTKHGSSPDWINARSQQDA
jgi:hypothetical protein